MRITVTPEEEKAYVRTGKRIPHQGCFAEGCYIMIDDGTAICELHFETHDEHLDFIDLVKRVVDKWKPVAEQ